MVGLMQTDELFEDDLEPHAIEELLYTFRSKVSCSGYHIFRPLLVSLYYLQFSISLGVSAREGM